MLSQLGTLADRADRRGPAVGALLANFEPGRRGESVAISEVHEVVAIALGAEAREMETAGGWQRKHTRNTYTITNIEVGRLFGMGVMGRSSRQTTRYAGLRWRADAPLRARVAEIREAADRRRYGL